MKVAGNEPNRSVANAYPTPNFVGLAAAVALLMPLPFHAPALYPPTNCDRTAAAPLPSPPNSIAARLLCTSPFAPGPRVGVPNRLVTPDCVTRAPPASIVSG